MPVDKADKLVGYDNQAKIGFTLPSTSVKQLSAKRFISHVPQSPHF